MNNFIYFLVIDMTGVHRSFHWVVLERDPGSISVLTKVLILKSKSSVFILFTCIWCLPIVGKLERFVVRKDNFVLVIKLAKLKITIGNYGHLREGGG